MTNSECGSACIMDKKISVDILFMDECKSQSSAIYIVQNTGFEADRQDSN